MALGDNKFKKGLGRGQRDVTGIRVPGAGPVPATVMLVSERPSRQDAGAKVPEPFTGMSGVEMDRYLAAGDIVRSDCFTTHLVRDYREGFMLEEWEIARDCGELDDEISMVEPRYIAAMGRATAKYFLGPDTDMDVVHGIPHWITHHDLGPVIVVPINHPASAFYNGDNQQDILEDFRRLGLVIRGQSWPMDSPGFLSLYEPNWINPWDLPDAQDYPGRIVRLAMDTEGWLHNPWGGSWCHDAQTGWVARKGDNSIDVLAMRIEKQLEYEPNFRVYLHNSLHDLPVLDEIGVHIPEGKFIDTMVLAYLLQTYPQGLKPLAFRISGMRMKSYEEVVAPYYSAVFEEYIRTAAEITDLPKWEEQYVIIQDGQPKIKKPWGIAKHISRLLADADKAAVAGKEFEWDKRWSNIDDYKKERVLHVLGEPPEPSLDYVPDEEAIPYSACDAVATRRIGPVLEAEVARMQLDTVCGIDHSIIPMIDQMQRVGMKADPEYFDRLAEECTEEMSRLQSAIHQMTGAMINCDSGDQVAELLFDQLRLDRGVQFEIRKTEAGDRYSTNDKILEALRFTHPVVPLVCDYREVSKIRSSFCWPIARYARQKADRRIHPNLRITRVVSGRLSCVKPNLLAIPVRSAIGKRVRAGFIPDEGHVYGDWDLDQIEMREMAHQSQDPVLLESFRTGLDVHTKTASLVFGKPYDEIRASKLLKSTMREPAKRIGFGIITGISGIGLAAQLRLFNATKNGLPIDQGGESWTEDDCDRLITEYKRVHYGISNYLDQCRAEARRFGFVRDRWGRIRYLPGVHSPIRHIREEALRQSHSHKISASAQGVMKIGMAAVWECIKQWWKDGHYVEPLLQVHDELLLEVEDDPGFRDEVDFMVVNCLTQTTTITVPLGAKGGFGRNWGEMK